MRGTVIGQGATKHRVKWDQHPQILLPMVCNKAGFGPRFKLPMISSLGGPACFYSRQNLKTIHYELAGKPWKG